MLSWEPPLEDGGSEITNYIVDKRETSRPNWAQVSATVPITSCTVEKLIEGHEYQFRICAENKYGVGDPIFTEPVIAKNPYGKQEHFPQVAPYLFEMPPFRLGKQLIIPSLQTRLDAVTLLSLATSLKIT